ncbi:cyanophycin synthetase [Legionella sp. PC997]|uniref:cyanophycin synthetase n=1 Tax=Legionella sp. PC997 TaxID=2755562 RepID=UPI0015F79FB4|nr:cyanophycin synthetase [Legionella sp. PC997]QMT59765.1 cyanophycin synthetase [Legionella sp. PC997]
MRILNIKVLRGPNYWSQERKKLIALKIDLDDLNNPAYITENFSMNLKKLLPSLTHTAKEHGNFFDQLDKEVKLSYVIGHIAVELQNLAGMHTSFEKEIATREKGIYYIVFSYEIEKAALHAAKLAVQITECIARGRNFLNLNNEISYLGSIYENEKLGPSTSAIIREAEARGIPWCKMEDEPLITLGYGIHQQKIWMTVSSKTSSIGVETAGNKSLTKKILASHFIPISKGYLVSSMEELEQILNFIHFPLAIKPFDGNHGNGVTCNIVNWQQARKAFDLAKSFSDKVIIEKHIEGSDFRFLVINFQLVAASKRVPAQVIGTGDKTIEELITEINEDPKRGEGHNNFLTRISVDEVTREILNERSLHLKSILKKGEVLSLKHSANISSGGTAMDVTDLIHPFNKKLMERVAKVIDLDICGIDAIVKNIEEPMNEENSAILEVNAAPGLRMHLCPSHGNSRNVAGAIVNSLFPPSKNFQIPIVAVTGTNGKTTVVRLIAHLVKRNQFKVGYTTTEGIYFDEELIYQGDCSGPLSAQAVLLNPNVNFAVLECARGGILRSGLGFTNCDISVITNITEDHLGLEDIHTLEELTKVKSVVAQSTKKEGYAILNAEDDLVYGLKEKLECNIALFGLSNGERIKLHCQKGGVAAFIEDESIILFEKNNRYSIALIKDIPLSFNGAAEFMIKNILAAVIASWLSGVAAVEIKKALIDFVPSEKNTPGRMNVYEFKDYTILLDYAHNQGGYLEIKKYLSTLDRSKKIGIISATGDRRSKDIQELGALSAQMFDEIIIKHNKDERGSSNDYLTSLLMEGIHAQNSDLKVKVISDEFHALEYAIENAAPGSIIFYSVDDVFSALKYIKEVNQRVNSK